MLKPQRPNRRIAGFSLLEVIIAMAVLVIGVSSLAALSATMIGYGRQSKYRAMAATLASEKLEDLSRWTGRFNSTTLLDNSDPEICVPGIPPQTVGDLDPTDNPTDYPSGTVTCTATDEDTDTSSSETEVINYYDQVSINVTNASDCPNPTDGCFARNVFRRRQRHHQLLHHLSFAGRAPSSSTSGSPVTAATAPANMTFMRHWVIESNPTVNGVTIANMRRITVRVALLDKSVTPAVSFTMSTLQP